MVPCLLRPRLLQQVGALFLPVFFAMHGLQGERLLQWRTVEVVLPFGHSSSCRGGVSSFLSLRVGPKASKPQSVHVKFGSDCSAQLRKPELLMQARQHPFQLKVLSLACFVLLCLGCRQHPFPFSCACAGGGTSLFAGGNLAIRAAPCSPQLGGLRLQQPPMRLISADGAKL